MYVSLGFTIVFFSLILCDQSAGMFFTARDFEEMINYVPNTTPVLVKKLLA